MSLELVKLALRRETGYPEGVTAPLYLACPCGQKVPIPETADFSHRGIRTIVTCGCGQKYDQRGYLVP